eukprot:3798018-Pleurochrysis_carterae.AAC.1
MGGSVTRHVAKGSWCFGVACEAHAATARHTMADALIDIGLLATVRLSMRASGVMRGVNACAIGAAAG